MNRNEYTLLVVDDDTINLKLLEGKLSPLGYRLLAAKNGQEALKSIARNKPDMVLLDIMMPIMDGYETLDQIRLKHSRNELPVIMLTAKSQPEDVKTACALGANDYLSKPYNFKKLQDKIESGLLQSSKNKKATESPEPNFSEDPDENARILIATIDNLPSLPIVINKIIEMSQKPEVVINDIARIINMDPAMTGKILSLINSAYYKLQRRIQNVTEAVNYLGLKTVQNLALTASLHTLLKTEADQLPLYNKIWKHSITVAIFSEQFSQQLSIGKPEDFFSFGILHDVGNLILLRYFPKKLKEIKKHIAEKNIDPLIAEQKILGTTHVRLLMNMLDKWGMPSEIKIVLEAHHHYRQADINYRKHAAILQLATYVASNIESEISSSHKENLIPEDLLFTLHLNKKTLTDVVNRFKKEKKKINDFMKNMQ